MDLQNLDLTKPSIVIGDKYIIQEKLGGGSFGQLYSAVSKENASIVAVKLEKLLPDQNALLNREARVLSDLRNEFGFPLFHSVGKEEEFSYLAMSLLGFNLEKLLKVCGKKFSLKTVLMLADQMLARIETLHEKNYLHRDIKPENFCVGPEEDSQTLYLIDFGLSKTYRESNGEHISYKDNRGLVGTARFASVNAHLGVEQSRRDDLESIGYTLIYFMKGELPWQNIKVEDKQKRYKMIAECKINTTVQALCEDLPEEFGCYLNYVKSLNFYDTPNYKYLRVLFRSLFTKMNYVLDYEYDWMHALNRYYMKKNLGKSQMNGRLCSSTGLTYLQRTHKPAESKARADFSAADFPQESKNPFTRSKKLDSVKPFSSETITQRHQANPQVGNSRVLKTDHENFNEKKKIVIFSSDEVDSQVMSVATESTIKNFPSTKSPQIRQLVLKKKNIETNVKGVVVSSSFPDDMAARSKALISKKLNMNAQEREVSQTKTCKRNSDLNMEENINEISVCEWEEENYIETMMQTKKFLINVKNF